jgi:hypothetical protein
MPAAAGGPGSAAIGGKTAPPATFRSGSRPGRAVQVDSSSPQTKRGVAMSAPGQPASFVVIGGGIVGLATAREILCTRPGVSVTLLEAPTIAASSTPAFTTSRGLSRPASRSKASG